MQAVKLDAVATAESAGDGAWGKENLRFDGGRPFNDLANCLRVLERHPDFKGRFKFNEMLSKVVDRGSVMVEWRVNEVAAELQERFMPEVAPETVGRALVIAANRGGK
jgi:hypothetical protein